MVILGLPGFVLAQGPKFTANIDTLPNDTSTGTTKNLLAKIVPGTAGQGKLILAATTDTTIDLYVVMAGAGTSGNAVIVVAGEAACVMDATNASGVAGQYVLASVTTAGRCHVQASPPANGMVVGKLIDDATTAGTVSRILMLNQAYVPGSGSGTGTVNSGTNKALACYLGTGTTLDDCVQIGTVGKYPKSNGTDFTLSTLGAGGVGACSNQVVTALNSDAAPTCTTVSSAMVNTTIAATGVDINTASKVIAASAQFAVSGVLSPTALSGDVNDYNPTNFATSSSIRINGGAADRNITGLAAQGEGDLKFLCNVGTTNALVLKNQSASSTAANRLLLSGDVTLPPDTCKTLRYDATTQRWRIIDGMTTDSQRLRPFSLSFGDPGVNAPPLTDDNDIPWAWSNDYTRDYKILTVACAAATGSPTITPIMTGGSATSILTGPCTCGTGAFAACAVNGAPIVHSYSGTGATCSVTPCSIDMNITVAGGTAKYIVVKVGGIIQ